MSCPVSRTLLPSGPDFDNVVFGACGSIVVRFCGHTSFPARHLPHSTVLERRLHLAIRQPSPGGLSAHLERLSDYVLPTKTRMASSKFSLELGCECHVDLLGCRERLHSFKRNVWCVLCSGCISREGPSTSSATLTDHDSYQSIHCSRNYRSLHL